MARVAGADAARLERWDRRSTPVVVVAAILPLAGALSGDPTEGVAPIVEVACWIVFVVDLGVRIRLQPGYLKAPWGLFDLGIVVVTFPVYLLVPDADEASVLALARLARVGRIAVVALRGAAGFRRLLARLGYAGLYALAVTLVCAVVVDRSESGRDGFESFGDSLWWAVVTLTTVGYGDLVPETTAGRFAAATLMLSGIAFLGVLAGSLSSFFGLDDSPETRPDHNVVDELRGLRDELAALTRRLGEDDPTAGPPR